MDAAVTWRTDMPDPGTEAWVWAETCEVLAIWTGKAWMAAGQVLRGVTHWRPK